MATKRDSIAAEVVFFRGPEGINDRIEAARGKQNKASWLRDAVDEKIERDTPARVEGRVAGAVRRV